MHKVLDILIFGCSQCGAQNRSTRKDNTIFSNYKFWPPEEVMNSWRWTTAKCYNFLLQNKIIQMKLNRTLNTTLYLVSTDLDIFEKRSTWRSDIWVYFGTCFICWFKVLKIVWSCWNEWVGVNHLAFSQFLKLMVKS